MTTTYGVDTYHLNIDVGDSTVVCLRTPANPPKGTRCTLLKAVLIDGGMPTGTSARILQQFVTELKEIYAVEPPNYPGGAPVFDAVVITHWDHDHYGGIISFIIADLADKANTTGRCTFFRYDAKTNDPLTYMYLPYMKATRPNQKDSQPEFQENSTTHNLDFKYAVKGSGEKLAPNLCLLKYGAQAVLGVDFFTNKQVALSALTGGTDSVDWDPVTQYPTPTSLLKASGLADGFPGLFCIGGHSYFCNFAFRTNMQV